MDNGLADTVGEGEGGTNWESTLRHTQDHVYNSQWEVKCLDVTGSSALDDLAGVGRKKARMRVSAELIPRDVERELTQCCKTTILQAKSNLKVILLGNNNNNLGIIIIIWENVVPKFGEAPVLVCLLLD